MNKKALEQHEQYIKLTEYALKRERIGAISVGAIAGLVIGATISSLATIGNDGRGESIESCPEEYSGIVEVTDKNALNSISTIAVNNSIRDSFSEQSTDFADKTGELACFAPIDVFATSNRLVLLPSGIDALDRGRSMPMSGELPDGLVWLSDPSN